MALNLRSILAGLATPNQQGGIFGGFQAGLSGALNQQALQEKAARDSIQAQLENDLKRRQVGAQEVSAQADMLRAGRGENDPASIAEYNFLTQTLGMDPTEASNRVFPQHEGGVGGELMQLLGLPPPKQDEAVSLYNRLHPNQSQGRQTFGEKVAEREQALGRKLTSRELAILAGVERNPLLESTQHQYIDQYGRSYYVDENGTPTTQRMGPKGPRQPYNVVDKRIYQGQEQDPLSGFYSGQ